MYGHKNITINYIKTGKNVITLNADYAPIKYVNNFIIGSFNHQ